MRILIVTETLHARGAETFLVRLANRLAQSHEVMLLNLHPYWSKPELIQQIDPKVTYMERKSPFRKVYQKLDGALLKAGIDYNLTANKIISYIRNLLISYKPDVVHSHLFKPDYYVAMARQGLVFNHVTTNHGDYLLYEKKDPVRLLNYRKKLAFLLQHIDHVVNISDDQQRHFQDLKNDGNYTFQLHKVLNGYAGAVKEVIRKTALGFGPEQFIFGMVASGIKEKGWEQAIQAFRQLNRPDAGLLLVGEGEELSRLKNTIPEHNGIVFAGFAVNPLDYINCFDVGLLPSYYGAESLPTVVIEYLYLNKPAIVTNIGEVVNMLQDEDGNAAGEIINFVTPADITAPLAAAMSEMLDNESYRTICKQRAISAFNKFKMENCISDYVKIYGS